MVLDGAMAMPFDPPGSSLLVARAERQQWNGLLPVEGRELVQVHLLNVAADAPFGEGERHPRLEPGDDPGLHPRMGVQVVVQPVGPGIHQRLEPLRARPVQRLHRVGIDEDLHAQVPPHLPLALGFRQPPHRIQVVGLHAIEVVFGLRIHHPEHGVGVGLPVDVRNPPIVANDRDVLSLPLPARDVADRRTLRAPADANAIAASRAQFLINTDMPHILAAQPPDRTPIHRRAAEVRGQGSGIRGQGPEVRSQRPEVQTVARRTIAFRSSGPDP